MAPRLRPPRLALLAVLAAAGETGCTRERLTGLFWSSTDEAHARHSLRQALYALRNEVQQELVRAGASLSLNGAAIAADVAQFRAALDAGELRRAAQLYRGSFLDGFYLSGFPEFERWVELERNRLANAAATAVQTLAQSAAAAADHEAAADWWYRATLLEPLSGRVALEYIRALAACGDRAKALAFVRAHESIVRRELETEPEPDIRRFEAELRAIPQVAPDRTGRTDPAASDSRASHDSAAGGVATGGTGIPTQQRPARRPVHRLPLAAAAALVLAGIFVQRATFGRDSRDSASQASPRSPIAARFFEEGVRAFDAADVAAARRLMAAALDDDSTFAMAAYHLAIMEPGDAFDARQRALRLARNAPEHARLTIMADLLQRDQEPTALRITEEWAAKYPHDARAFATLGSVRAYAGDWGGAVAAFEKAITLQQRTEKAAAGECRSCDHYNRLLDIYFWWDSLPAVERVARRALGARPGQAHPWAALALAAARAGDSTAAFAHLRRYQAATPARTDPEHELRLRLTLEQYDRVEREILPLLSSPRQDETNLGRWMLFIVLRNQGRLRDAAQLLQTGQIPGSAAALVPPGMDLINEALVALESGHPNRAAAYFDTRRLVQPLPQAAGTKARWLAWNATLAATALAEAGDTARVRQLADTVEYWGSRSLFGRDRKAHHFLRGLLLRAADRHAEAVREFRAAIHSSTLGYTRINYELAKCLLSLGRPKEAVRVLRSALRGEIDAANLYVTRTDLHELLALAYHQLGEPDSAAAHDRAVVRAWARADPQFSSRLEAARRRLDRQGLP